MEIKASDVKKLRESTGAGMMDCKKALTEAGGDFKKAEKILKELGLAAAAKRSGRATNEGRIFSLITDKKGTLLELACETDFVARNQDFIEEGQKIIKIIQENMLSEVTSEIEERIKLLISKLKENIAVRRFVTIEAEDNEILTDYIHGEGRIGVLVKISVDDPKLASNEKIKNFAFDCALHIAAFNPRFLAKEFVDQDYLKEQEEIFTKQALSLGKPEKVVQGIVKGKLNKHLSEVCLVNQPFVKDDKQSVEKIYGDLGKELGTKLNITDYKYYSVGEEL